MSELNNDTPPSETSAYQELEDLIDDIAHTTTSEFQRVYPRTYKALLRHVADPCRLVVQSLKADAVYEELVRQTEDELSRAATLKLAVDIAFSVLRQVANARGLGIL